MRASVDVAEEDVGDLPALRCPDELHVVHEVHADGSGGCDVVGHVVDEDLDRRPKGWEFSKRLRESRETYYRIWLSRPSRILLNAWHMVGRDHQPSRAVYHLKKALSGGPSTPNMRRPAPLESVADEDYGVAG